MNQDLILVVLHCILMKTVHGCHIPLTRGIEHISICHRLEFEMGSSRHKCLNAFEPKRRRLDSDMIAEKIHTCIT